MKTKILINSLARDLGAKLRLVNFALRGQEQNFVCPRDATF